ncbi:uncharacterized protein LOC142765635 [Rhipicephalus microplus]|uniref:uncharacterized protein LOC142765635 n=1 Tax=Rhipicephalus microplus TaxID=6941 RepID=UPI003F6B2E73
MFHFIESRVVELVLYMCLVILVHLFLTALAVDVRKEIAALAKVYDKYYKVVYRGQKRMKLKEETARERPSPQDPPLVASKEARRQRHRRRYLDARPTWKQLSKQIASPAAASSV